MDFFTPIVDDPHTFGQIAVANALSDVYAMGGKPVTAMNIVCFPSKKMDLSILGEILRGGLDKMKEAGVLLVGGHSVEDDEPKYGLSVTGTVHPENVWLNSGCRIGDRLVLTKPLGTGIINTAVKGEVADPGSVEEAIALMVTLNGRASELAGAFDIHACTDITGFGFLGHACEMAEGSGTGMVIDSSSIPFIPGARDLAEMGVIPGGLHRNRAYRSHMVAVDPGVPRWMTDILFDPQTSGGLLFSLPSTQAEDLVDALRDSGIAAAAVVGEVIERSPVRIVVR